MSVAYGIEVYRSEEYIVLKQQDLGDGEPIILIHPDQLDLVDWMNKAKQEGSK